MTSTIPHVPEKESGEDNKRMHLAFVQRNNNNNATHVKCHSASSTAV